MGPQLDSCGRASLSKTVAEMQALQWGRNLTVAEGVARRAAGGPDGGASMGPQLDSCGRSRILITSHTRRIGFNGAAT